MSDVKAAPRDVMLADGAWSTELRARGWRGAGAPAELANLTHETLVSDVAQAYLAAGCDFLSTNTFAANPLAWPKDAAHGWRDVLHAGVTISRAARDAAGSRARLAAALGPSQRVLAVGETDESALTDCYAQAASIALRAGADLILLQTFSQLAEAVVAVQAIRATAPGVEIVAGMSFDSGPQRTRTLTGDEAAACAPALRAAGATMVGLTCGAGVAHALPAVVALRSNCDLPLWIAPSVGLPDLEEGRAVYAQTPEDFATRALALLEPGVAVLGGCCGAGPAHIRRLAALLAARRARGTSRPGAGQP